jgi:hypothetical protein
MLDTNNDVFCIEKNKIKLLTFEGESKKTTIYSFTNEFFDSSSNIDLI